MTRAEVGTRGTIASIATPSSAAAAEGSVVRRICQARVTFSDSRSAAPSALSRLSSARSAALLSVSQVAKDRAQLSEAGSAGALRRTAVAIAGSTDMRRPLAVARPISTKQRPKRASTTCSST